MPAITVPRADLAIEEMVAVLGEGLGARPQRAAQDGHGRTILRDPRKGPPNTIVVGAGESGDPVNRLERCMRW
jgi:hypothetical protein